MFKLLFIIVISLLSTLNYAQEITASPIGFESPEHITIGENIFLQFSPDTAKTNKFLFTLPNGVILTYAEIMTLGGDFYGVVEKPIALGQFPDDRKKRFENAYATLAIDPNALLEVPKILADIKLEMLQVQEGIDKGENPRDIYARIATDHTVEWNCITGGFCASDSPGLPKDAIHKIFFLKQGRYLKLSDTDYDHFEEFAWMSYTAGHSVALAKAIEAHNENDIKKLEEAYAMNAFACHYLSDLFSSGHMRTPHYLLSSLVFPSTLGSILTNYMHNEDNQSGLLVTNHRGDKWKAYGDTCYLDARNQVNRDLLQQALQTSADEVFAVYTDGKNPTSDKVFPFVPDLELLTRSSEYINTSPLFFWDKQHKQLMRRTHINDMTNFERTPVWVGWETLLELVAIKGLPQGVQAQLLSHDDTRAYALQLGLISDKELLNFYLQFKK